MINRRPDPKALKRKLLDIRLRYDAHSREVKRHRRSRAMAAIRLAELTRWLDDAFGAGVELPPDEPSYLIVRIFAHHMGALSDPPRRILSWVTVYAPWISPRDRERLVNEVTDCPIKWTADKLAWKLKLTDAKRTELKIKTIGAIDCNREQREERRKTRRKERDAKRYQVRRRSPNISML